MLPGRLEASCQANGVKLCAFGEEANRLQLAETLKLAHCTEAPNHYPADTFMAKIDTFVDGNPVPASRTSPGVGACIHKVANASRTLKCTLEWFWLRRTKTNVATWAQ